MLCELTGGGNRCLVGIRESRDFGFGGSYTARAQLMISVVHSGEKNLLSLVFGIACAYILCGCSCHGHRITPCSFSVWFLVATLPVVHVSLLGSETQIVSLKRQL